jgi:hypothetical protein
MTPDGGSDRPVALDRRTAAGTDLRGLPVHRGTTLWFIRDRYAAGGARRLCVCALVLRPHNSQNLLMWWGAPEFSLRPSGHSPLLMALGRGGEAVTVVGIARIASGPFLQLGPGARPLKKWRPPSIVAMPGAVG